MAFRFPLSVQIVLPEQYREDETFRETLLFLGARGFHGLELNIRDPLSADFRDIAGFLGSFGLRMTMFASGLSAREMGLSLSHPDRAVREKTVCWCGEVFQRLHGTGAGFIAGFIKGGPGMEKDKARADFRESLEILVPAAERSGVDLLIEATNRHESSVANTLGEAAELIRDFKSSHISILPDTYHMNTEETDMFDAMRRHAGLFRSIHLSDDNRRFPGHGSIDFARVIGLLGDLQYAGGLAIEGNSDDFVRDMERSVTLLAWMPAGHDPE
jgi:sugar phosphate isomerase/epimerase